MYNWTATSEDQNKRVLAFIKERVDQPTKQLRYSIEHHGLRLNGRVERYCSTRLKKGDSIHFILEQAKTCSLEKERILYEDEWLLIYNKPSRLSSEALQKEIGLSLAHRLDRDTTGLLIFAKDEQTLSALEELFLKQLIKKRYLALVHGRTHFDKKIYEGKLLKIRQQEGKMVWAVSEKEEAISAKTTFYTQFRGLEYSLLHCVPQTGRSHQIRAHLQGLGHPIVGDIDYGDRRRCEAMRPLLHAEKVNFAHPKGKKIIELIAPLPEDFEKAKIALLK